VTSPTGWSHSFTLLRLAPALIWEPGERPAPFAGTVAIVTTPADKDADAAVPTPAIVTNPTAEDQEPLPRGGSDSIVAPVRPHAVQATPDVIEDMLAMVGMVEPSSAPQDGTVDPADTSDMHSEVLQSATAAVLRMSAVPTAVLPSSTASPSGEHFMEWLRQGIVSRKLIINDAKALVHTVSNTAYLVSPGVFQRYAQEHPQVGFLAKQEGQQDWQWVQKRFEKIGLHRKHSNGLNIWSCEVTGPRKSRRLHGYLLEDATQLFHELPPNNPYLSISP
jgi:hypothetical protein